MKLGKPSLIDGWKQSLRLHTVQLALLFTLWQWWETLQATGLPTDVTGWVNNLIGLAFILLRVVAQPVAPTEGEE